MTRLVALAALLTTALVLTACEPFGDKDKENLNKACGTAPPALSTMPVLPGAFRVALPRGWRQRRYAARDHSRR